MGAKWAFLGVVLFFTACATSPGPVAKSASGPVGDGAGEKKFERPSLTGTVPANAPLVHADSAILIDAATGAVLYEKLADQRRPAASTQKLLTALIVAESGSLVRPVSLLGSDILVGGTLARLKIGETYSRYELLEAALLKSGNDAALALARSQTGSEAAFCRLMNRRAIQCGAYNSQFKNPHGLDTPGQFTTARDLARIARVAYRNPVLREIFAKESADLTDGRNHHSPLWNTNELVYRSSIYTGMKPGFTAQAGKCLVASVSYEGRDAILVQLHGAANTIFDDAENVFHWALGSPVSGPNLWSRSAALALR